RTNARRYCTAIIYQCDAQWASLEFGQAEQIGARSETLQKGKKKGRSLVASGPSLGRKRPRRAAAVQSTTAPQYMIGLIRNASDTDLIFYANLQMCPSPGNYQLHLQ